MQDFKREMSPKNHFTLANDVAAFANHLGGTLWIGIVEGENGNVGERAGIPPAVANELEKAFSEAAKRRCKPLPIYDFERFTADDSVNVILAVFVEPYVGGELIGVSVEAREPGAKHDDPFVFPMRSGKVSKYIQPGQLLMFTEPRIRRVFCQLSAIPLDQEVYLAVVSAIRNNSTRGVGVLVRVSEQTNSVHFRVANAPPATGVVQHVYAIDQVRTVHGDGQKWWITIDSP